MKQAEDTQTLELPGLPPPLATETGKRGGHMQSLFEMRAQLAELAHQARRAMPRGAYKGAVKIGAENQAARAQTGKSQEEFALLCNVSVRTLRTWERGDPVSAATRHAIASKLDLLQPKAAPRRPVKYRCPMTGSTWSGRGLMPRWLKVRMEEGRRLADFIAP